MSRTLLIDSDIVAFKYAATSEDVFYFGGKDCEPSVNLRPESYQKEILEYIEKMAVELRADHVIVCLTDSHNFRKDVDPTYKHNRVGVRKPALLKEVKDYLASKYRSYIRPGLEADDVMGILATHKTLVPGEKIIVSEDKDMRGVPAKVYNPNGKRKQIISPLEADRWFMTQVLTGDTTDGYPGCPGVGPKSPFVASVQSAASLKEMWDIVVEAYVKKKLTEADAIRQARLARILRACDYDFKKKQVLLWNPPK